jgi:hypothetical protein
MRAAVVGGGAYVAGKHMARKSEEAQYAEDEQNQRIADLEAQQQQGQYGQPPQQYQQQQYQQPPPQYQQPPPQAPPAQGSSMLDQLNQLNELRQQGALTDEEFAAAKAKLLGS